MAIAVHGPETNWLMGETIKGWKMFCSKSEPVHGDRKTCTEGKIQELEKKDLSPRLKTDTFIEGVVGVWKRFP